MTVLVVDGYNAMHAIPEARKRLKESLRSARDEVIAISREYARSSGFISDVRVVFDGDDRYRYLDKLDIKRDSAQVFSKTGFGDEKIIEVIKQLSCKGKVVLASNDNYVRNGARGYGASLIHSEDLLRSKKIKKQGCVSHKKSLGKSVREEITKAYRRVLGV